MTASRARSCRRSTPDLYGATRRRHPHNPPTPKSGRQSASTLHPDCGASSPTQAALAHRAGDKPVNRNPRTSERRRTPRPKGGKLRHFHRRAPAWRGGSRTSWSRTEDVERSPSRERPGAGSHRHGGGSVESRSSSRSRRPTITDNERRSSRVFQALAAPPTSSPPARYVGQAKG